MVIEICAVRRSYTNMQAHRHCYGRTLLAHSIRALHSNLTYKSPAL